MNKSVIGRAVVGDLIMGPLGAVIGGMSALGAKQGVVVTQYVVINFWDVNTRTPQTLLITCNGDQTVDAFINRQKEEARRTLLRTGPRRQNTFLCGPSFVWLLS